MKAFFITFGWLFFLSCTHRSVVYNARVKSENGEIKYVSSAHKETFYGHASACAITAIAAGGWCWAYLFLPQADAYSIAEYKAKQKLVEGGNGYFVLEENYGAYDWNSESDFVLISDSEIDSRQQGLPSPAEQILARPWAVSLDFGTDHSPYGIGARFSWFKDANEIYLAYGQLAKQNILGKPWAVGYAFHFNNMFASLGASYFRGMGERYPVYQEGYVGEKQHLKWQLMFINASVGTFLDIFKNNKIFTRVEAGFSGLANAEIEVAKKSDQSTIGAVSGIARKDVIYNDDSSKQMAAPQKFVKGEGGPYVQMAFIYRL